MVGSEKKRLENEDIHQNVYNNLKALYNRNYQEILMFAGKYYDDLEEVN